MNLDRGLGDIGVIVEAVVITDLVDNAIESVGVDTNFSPVLIEIIVAPVFKEVELQRLLDGRMFAEDPL